MSIKKEELKTKLNDWFIITKIRVLNFIKEHKYVSAGIGIFMFSCIVALIVFATNDDPYSNKIKVDADVKQKGTTTSEEITEIKSFSTIVYDLSYDLKLTEEQSENTSIIRDSVVINASLKSDIDANWKLFSDESSNYSLSEDKKTLTVTLYNIKVGEGKNQKLYLDVNNVLAGNEVEVEFKIYESTATDENLIKNETKKIVVKNDKVINNLSYKVVGGNAYKSSKFEDGRLAPFGIILGFNMDENESLEGLYFNPGAELILSASQNDTQLSLMTEEGFYGKYESSIDYIKSMPLPYDSGKASISTTTTESSSNNETKTPKVYLIGAKELNLKKGDTYTESGIKLDDGKVFCKTTSANCTRKILYNGTEATLVDTTKEGTYNISYKYTNNNQSITLRRTVKIEGEKNTVLANGDTYSLQGNENVYLSYGSPYKIEGILKNGKSSTNINSSYEVIKNGTEIKNEDETPIEKLSEIGEYIIRYKVLDTDNEPLKDDDNNDIVIERKINIVNDTLSQVLTSYSNYYSTGKEIEKLTVILDNESDTKETLECLSNDKCTVTYYSDSNLQNKIDTIDNNKPGTYYVKYVVTDKNGFELSMVNTIIYQTIYKMKIENIKLTSNNITKMNDGFVALGAYYVNVMSPRSGDNNNDIGVKLSVKSNGLEEAVASVINKYYSGGTKTNTLDFYTENYGELEKIPDDNNYLSYGEEVILGSNFNYLKDGDNNITTLTNTIDLKEQFSLLNYDSNAETSLEYYLSVNNKRVITVEDDKLKYASKDDKYLNIEEIESFKVTCNEDEEGNIISISYTATNIKPGTLIDFRVKLMNANKNHDSKIDINSNLEYVQNSDTNKISASSTVNITAFKARTKLYVSDLEQDIVIDGSNTDSSKWAIYPSVSLPAELVKTNVADIDELDDIKIEVILPEGINYIYNENYDIPKLSNNKKTLTYNLKEKHVNDWIEPIEFYTSYDINIPSGTNLEVKVKIQATAKKISDISSENLRTTTRIITYQNNEPISYSQYTPYFAISKNTSFTINTKLYNNTNVNKNDLAIVTLLPYNDVSNNNKKYNGTYTISNLPTGAYCTTALPNMINKNNILNNLEISWEDCSKYKDDKDNYIGVTAIKVDSISLDVSKIYEQQLKINPIGNNSDDVYEVKSYLVIRETNELKEMKTEVSVVSKKITGVVWEDFDSNGLIDEGEKKVSGVTLNLYSAKTNELIKNTVSDEKGNYSLTDLEPGTYFVTAEYNTVKYGISPYRVSIDKGLTSAFAPESRFLENNSGTNTLSKKLNNEKSEENIEPEKKVIIRTDNIEITDNTRIINNINLGLALRKIYSVKLTKYVTKAIVTNNLGITTIKDYGNVSLAKLDVKDINNLNIKVIYTLELENTGYYPGYVYSIKDYVPEGMEFNEKYDENKGWILSKNGYLENTSLENTLIQSGEKKYITIAFDIVRKEAGSFVNYAEIDDDDLQILTVSGSEEGEKYE